MGALWEFASFVLRSLGSKNQQNATYAFVSTLLVFLGPLWINAFDYMVLGRMIHFFITEKEIWGFKATKIAKTFVWLDILSFLTQATGVLILQPGVSASQMQLGIHIYMGGIGFQELSILIFTSLVMRFLIVKRAEDRLNLSSFKRCGNEGNWRRLVWALYTSLALITVRIVFRMIEYSKGTNPSTNPVPFHEAYFYCFDAVPMLMACVIMNCMHPGRVLVGEGSEFPKGPTRKEKKAIKAAKKAEKRATKEAKKQVIG